VLNLPVLIAIFLLAAQAAAYKAPRLKGTTHPDLNGLWQAVNEGNWDIQAHAAQPGPPQFGALFAVPAGAGIVEGNELPYQTWALAKKNKNFKNRFVCVKIDDVREEPLDPEAKCYLPGVPPDMLWYESTIDDLKVFTRSWKMSFPLYRRLDKNAQFLEFKCVPFAEELVYAHLRKETNK
jgi:hypothetical protein